MLIDGDTQLVGESNKGHWGLHMSAHDLWYHTFNGVHFLDESMSIDYFPYNHMCDER